MEEYGLDEPKSGLYTLFAALFYIILALFLIVSLLTFANFLDDFLHAPIGIKDNPPEPGALIQWAQAAWTPLALMWLLFGWLKFGLKHFSTVPFLLTTVILVCAPTALVGGFLGESKKQYFHGQQYFAQTVTPVLYIFFLMACVGFGANHCIEKWKKSGKVRHGLAGAILILAIMCGLVGLYVGAINSDKGAPLVLIGMLLCGIGVVVYNANQLLGKKAE